MDTQLDSLLPVTSHIQPKPSLGVDLGRAIDALTPLQQRQVEKCMDEIVEKMSEGERKEFLTQWNASRNAKIITIHKFGMFKSGKQMYHFYGERECAKKLHAIIQHESRPNKWISVVDTVTQEEYTRETETIVKVGNDRFKGSDFTLKQCEDVVRSNQQIELTNPRCYIDIYRHPIN
jgi:hypothetical protein